MDFVAVVPNGLLRSASMRVAEGDADTAAEEDEEDEEDAGTAVAEVVCTNDVVEALLFDADSARTRDWDDLARENGLRKTILLSGGLVEGGSSRVWLHIQIDYG